MDEELGKYTQMTWPRSLKTSTNMLRTCKEYTREKA